MDAVDRSIAGVEELTSRAGEAGSPVRAWVQDLRTLRFQKSYELVIAHGVLHLLDRNRWKELLRSMQRETAPGGWNVVADCTDRLPAPDDLAPYMRGLFREGELDVHS